MEDSRPAKRARQACDPCRRKKSRCPGEKPTCSYCERLGQECVYNDNEPDANIVATSRKMEQRMENLEGKLDQLLEHISPISTTRQQPQPPQVPSPTCSFQGPVDSGRRASVREFSFADAQPSRLSWSFENPVSTIISDNLILSEADLHETGKLYLTWCHCQPVILFREETFLDSIQSRDHELLLSIQALALRFPAGTLMASKQSRLDAMSERSRRLTMDRVINGQVELSTLQSLCLLTIIDVADGKFMQAGVSLSMASSIANGIPIGKYLGDPQECVDCIRSITLLQNLQSSVFPVTTLADAALTSRQSARSWAGAWPSNAVPTSEGYHGSYLKSRLDQDILKYTSQLSEVWHLARMYAASRVGPDAPPPWDPSSDYSLIMQRHMVIDSRVPLKYRFSANKFGEQTFESLQQRRHYWGPWLFLQLTYAAIPCLLNHPFLLSMRLRNFRDIMPQSFIHQSFELITRHAGWIVYFIDLLDKMAFQLSDPWLAHCVVVVATINLQHSFVPDDFLRKQAQTGFDTCLKFLRRMGTMWPQVLKMAQNLEKLQRSVSVAPASRQSTGRTGGARQTRTIDVQLLWNLLVYETAGQREAKADESIFMSPLVAIQPPQEGIEDNDPAEYDLVGSAGISGHKTVPHESIVYPPEDTANLRRESHKTGNDVYQRSEQALSLADRYFDGVAVESGYEGFGLQATDFGRAIEDWLDFDFM